MHVTPAAWVLTLVAIVSLLALDWFTHGRRPHEVGLAEAIKWSLVFIGVAVLFGVGLGLAAGWDLGAQYFAGYVVEKSLSIDNLFVFAIIIGNFAIPAAYQPKVLTLGITTALALRGLFIALGAALLQAFTVMLLVFGLVLVVTAVQLYRHRNEDPSIEENTIVRAARRVLPISRSYDGGRITTRADGRLRFTPLLLALLAIGSSDLLFAFDSIPAVFGVTDHAYIVFAANAFALLGLRALYFLVANILMRLVYLSTALALVLAFIGTKLILEYLHRQSAAIPEVSTLVSLALIAVTIAVATLASLRDTRRHPGRRAHAGSLRRADGMDHDGGGMASHDGGRETTDDQPVREADRHASAIERPVASVDR